MFIMHALLTTLYVYASLNCVAFLITLEEAEGLDPSGSTSNVGPTGTSLKPNFSNFYSFLA